ncbi:MAG: hypothetical protein HY588_01255 [Candidatus Omnitrophica bacterium]|nr:hypothetical protein [Candidatus Omnitrophota bacterium]
MNFGKMLPILLVLIFSLTTPALSETKKEDLAVPAISDLPLLGASAMATERLNQNLFREKLNPLPDIEKFQWLDLNRDLRLNDFDAKQFQNIIENLRGEKLTGLELTARFRIKQKNQAGSFLLLFDLDRDGMFTTYDVDYFTQIVNHLDEGATRGNELVQKFKFQIFPKPAR